MGEVTNIEIIDNEHILIGDKTLKMFYHDPPINGATYSLETSSDQNHNYQPKLFVRQLSGITATMLPSNLDISISNPKSSFRFIDFLEIKKRENECVMIIYLTLYFSKWDYSYNLVQWSANFRSLLQKSSSKILSVGNEKDEYGVTLNCNINLANDDDLYDTFKEMESAIEQTYLESIQSDELTAPKDTLKSKTKDRNELKWWIQYVVIPLLGSGAFAAVIAWLVSK